MVEQESFEDLDIRVGEVVEVEDFPEARKPLFKLTIDLGPELGRKRSGAGVTGAYREEDLLGRQVVAVVNLPPRRIVGFVSECLVLGALSHQGEVILLGPDRPVPNGSKVF
ncbi:MAG: tRNA-binding protein [Nitrospinota bacterium]